MLRPLYDWTMGLAGHRHAIWWLALVSFVESSIFPIPPDVLLIPMILAAPTQAFRIALVCTVSSVIGGMVGYGIGFFLYETVARQFWISTAMAPNSPNSASRTTNGGRGSCSPPG